MKKWILASNIGALPILQECPSSPVLVYKARRCAPPTAGLQSSVGLWRSITSLETEWGAQRDAGSGMMGGGNVLERIREGLVKALRGDDEEKERGQNKRRRGRREDGWGTPPPPLGREGGLWTREERRVRRREQELMGERGSKQKVRAAISLPPQVTSQVWSTHWWPRLIICLRMGMAHEHLQMLIE